MFIIDSIFFVWTLLNIAVASVMLLVEEYPALIPILWIAGEIVSYYISQFLNCNFKK